jgi:hypothetical protein
LAAGAGGASARIGVGDCSSGQFAGVAGLAAWVVAIRSVVVGV